jgi:hypothetical protein
MDATWSNLTFRENTGWVGAALTCYKTTPGKVLTLKQCSFYDNDSRDYNGKVSTYDSYFW